MRLKTLLFLLEIIMFGNHYHFIDTKAIIGSNKIKQVVDGEFSSVACLIVKITENSIEQNTYCTATFISQTHLLTSEHCLTAVGEIGFVVNAGSHDIRLGYMYFPIWWLTFKTFINIYTLTAKYKNNDIGIIRVSCNKNEVKSDKKIWLPEAVENIIPSPISKVSPSNKLYGKKLKIVGCGFSNTGQFPIIKEKAPVKVISNIECSNKSSKHVGKNIFLTDNYICSYNKPYILLAIGDFGGPLLLNGEIVAINVGLSPLEGYLDDPKKKNLHLIIDEYRYFIDYNMRI